MSKKMWRKPEVRSIDAGSAEATTGGKNSDGAKAAPNKS